jgi:hypothetical protein
VAGVRLRGLLEHIPPSMRCVRNECHFNEVIDRGDPAAAVGGLAALVAGDPNCSGLATSM